MQAAPTIELDSTDRFGNNELHKLVLKGDPQTLFENAIANPDLLIQKNRHGQTPLHLIHFIFAFRAPHSSKQNDLKKNLLFGLIKLNPQALEILDKEGNSLIDLLIKKGSQEDKKLAAELTRLNPELIERHKLGIELETIQREFTDNFGESLGEEDQLPEQQPLLKKEKPPSSSTLPIPQEIKQQKQESSIREDQKNLNEELLQACKNNKKMRALLLVRKGANPNALCQSGESAISYAKATGDNRLVTELQKEEG